MHDLQDGASIVSILLKPLLADGVGTAALRRAEEPLGGLSATSLVYCHPIPAVVLRTSKHRWLSIHALCVHYTFFSDVLPVEAKLCMSSEIGRADRVCLGPKTGRYLFTLCFNDGPSLRVEFRPSQFYAYCSV